MTTVGVICWTVLTVVGWALAGHWRERHHAAESSVRRLTSLCWDYERRVVELETAACEAVPAGPRAQLCRCDVCGRVVEGVPGAACPGCGGENES